MKTPVFVGHHGDHGFLEQFERLPVLCESGTVENHDDDRQLVDQHADPKLIVPLLDDGENEGDQTKTERRDFASAFAGLTSQIDHFGQQFRVLARNEHISASRLTASPVPMATPTSETASAAASLNPSPTIMVM